MVDEREKPGGVCLFVGCIPSKALLFVSEILGESQHASEFGIHFEKPEIDLAGLRKWKQGVVNKLTSGLAELAKLRGVEFIQGRAAFDSSESLRLENSEISTIRFKHAILASGARPMPLPRSEAASSRLLDSTGALELEEVPKTLLVIGGGYIGLELGTVYAALGSRVTVVEMLDGLLPGVDRDLVRPLEKRIRALFENVYLKTKVSGMKETKRGIEVQFQGEVEEKKIFQQVLVSIGRKPNSENLGLENTGVELDKKGFVRIDRQCRTKDKRIFAIGDVAGQPMLAHKAMREGKIAAEVIAGRRSAFDNVAIPAVVFTDPEVAWCGLTETKAKEQGREVKVTRFPWGALGRSLAMGRSDGMTKMLFDPETGRVLGVGIVGARAGELIAEGVLAVEMAAVAEDLAATIHTHPTLSESMGEAAEAFLGHAVHVYRK